MRMDPISILLMLVAALAGAGVGFFIGKRGRNSLPAAAEPPEAGEAEDPTAPIAPVIEIARSPHDRVRDLAIGNSLVKSLDLVDALLKSGERQTRESLLGQIGLLRTVFEGLLGSCSFRFYRYEEGTSVDAGMRGRIQIVGGTSGDGPTRIARVVREGVLYEPGGGEAPQIIRKAEVEIG
jgi:hypothetical protein